MNNEIPERLRLIASGTHIVGIIPVIFFSVLPPIIVSPSGDILIVIIILAYISQPIAVSFGWRASKHIHPFVDISGRDAVNCALNTLLGRIVSILFCTFIFSVTCGIGSEDPTLFLISLLILSFVEVAYFINSVITGIFALRGCRFNSILIYPFIKSE
jgi:uncharacterized Tic20 family protein